MKIVVDRSRCTGLGICESISPSTFEVDDLGVMVVQVDDVAAPDLDDVQRAVSTCPTGALSLQA